MDHNINYGRYGQQLYFAFLDPVAKSPVPIDPSIGAFQIINTRVNYDKNKMVRTNTDIEDLKDSEDDASRKKFSNSFYEKGGIYKLKDPSQIEFFGSFSSSVLDYMYLEFRPCYLDNVSGCESKQKI